MCGLVIQVLATDMSKHLDHLAHLKTMVETHRLSGGSTTLLLSDVGERLQVSISLYCNTNRCTVFMAPPFVDWPEALHVCPM